MSTWDNTKLVGTATLPLADTLLVSNNGDCGGALHPRGASGGKFYAELTCTNSGINAPALGIKQSGSAMPPGGPTGYIFSSLDVSSIGYQGGWGAGSKVAAGGIVGGYGVEWDAPGTPYVVSILLDATTGELRFWVNGADQGVAWSNALNAALFPLGVDWFIVAGQHGGGGGVTETFAANFGETAFVYTPPAGYVGWYTGPPPVISSALLALF